MGSRLNGLALCAGVGGIELGLHPWVRTVCYVEREAYPAACLVSRMQDGLLDEAPIYSDLRSFDAAAWRGKVDIVTAGSPCQAFSHAARGKNVAPDLLPYVLRTVLLLRPSYLFVENVPPAVGGIRTLLQSLRGAGYSPAGIVEVAASSLGASHDRRRIFALTYSNCDSKPMLPEYGEVAQLCRPPEDFAWSEAPTRNALGADDGLPYRVDRLRALGNGVVPACARRAFLELASRVTCKQ